MLANLSLKYSQSNNVAMAYDGQLIGISAGQQSRIHTVRLCTRKAQLWLLRHTRYVNHIFQSTMVNGMNGQTRTNVIIRLLEYVLGDKLTKNEESHLQMYFKDGRIPYTLLDRIGMKDVSSSIEVSMASDAFFPFRDNIDCASTAHIKAIAQPGGSTRDQYVIDACNEYGISMVCHNKRMFTH